MAGRCLGGHLYVGGLLMVRASMGTSVDILIKHLSLTTPASSTSIIACPANKWEYSVESHIPWSPLQQSVYSVVC